VAPETDDQRQAISTWYQSRLFVFEQFQRTLTDKYGDCIPTWCKMDAIYKLSALYELDRVLKTSVIDNLYFLHNKYKHCTKVARKKSGQARPRKRQVEDVESTNVVPQPVDTFAVHVSNISCS